MSNLFDVSGKVAVVTGGSRGIGEMIASAYLDAGMKRVYITARKAEACEETAKRLSEKGECIALPGDLSTVEGIEKFVAEISEREDKIDVLVNNAGATWGASFDKFPESAWDKVMDINVKSTFFLTQKMYPLLKADATAEAPGRVINIASIDGINPPNMDNFSYTSAKSAVIMLTRHLAKRLIRDNIIVNGIAPGPFYSKMTAALLDNMGDEIKKMSPNKRIGTPEDIGGVAIFLASRASQNTLGATVPCDGGFSTIL